MKKSIEIELEPGTNRPRDNAYGITGRVTPVVTGSWRDGYEVHNRAKVTINERGNDARATRRLKKVAKQVGVPLRQFVRDVLNGDLDLDDLDDLMPEGGRGLVASAESHPLYIAARGYAERNNIRGEA